MLNFVGFLLTDERYYDIPKNEIGGVLGTVGMYCEIIVVVQGFVIGPLTDVIGRKPPVIIGFLVAGTALILIPYFKVIWPWFFILRSTVYCGCMIGLNLPLLPDYVAP